MIRLIFHLLCFLLLVAVFVGISYKIIWLSVLSGVSFFVLIVCHFILGFLSPASVMTDPCCTPVV